jgi:single-strand DNA-binding protein
MATLNRVYLMGNLTRDPELRYTPSGTAVASFGLAVNRRYRHGEEWKEETCFVDVAVFGRQAETVSEYLSKGRQALVEGRLTWRSWEADDGTRRSKHEVVAQNVQFIGGRPSASEAAPKDPAPTPDDEDDDIPF